MRLSREFIHLLDAGDMRSTEAAFEREIAAADTDAERATIALSYGTSVARIASRDGDEERLEAATKYFEYAIAHGADRERLAALNNYATANLKLGNSTQAVALFSQGLPQVQAFPDPAVRARYLHNFGEALLQHGDPSAAIPVLVQAFDADPASTVAAEAGVRAAITAGDGDRAGHFAGGLLRNGHEATAASALRQLLAPDALPRMDDSRPVIEAFYDYLVASRTDQDAYRNDWEGLTRDALGRVEESGRQYLNFVPLAYSPELPVVLEPISARIEFAPWLPNPEDGKLAADLLGAPSRFLTGVGEIYAEQGDVNAALARYALSWSLDTTNVQAGQYAANLMTVHREKVDPQRRLFSQFVFNLFEGKGEAYLGNDWPAIFRFHVVLASLYVQEGQWGDEHRADGAIFQLQHALRARARIADSEARGIAVPGLYGMLGQAYAGIGDEAKAFDNYLHAARDALRLEDREQARQYLRAARALPYSPTEDQIRRFRQVTTALG
ncbi:MAG: tetratricopeptide repeat protein [Ectothiorhodospiraceae bacterium]|nr:tetratricopeptide repeat protein [Ectothiorhodospiraceae bacterium]